jgi:hypothetical protein
MTAKELGDRDGDNGEIEAPAIHSLITKFAIFLIENRPSSEHLAKYEDEMGKEEAVIALVDELKIGKEKIIDVMTAAIELSRLIARQRSWFSIEISDIAKMGFIKREDDDEVTAASSGAVTIREESDLCGDILYCFSPILRKWGNGAGQKLDQDFVYIKGTVCIDSRE